MAEIKLSDQSTALSMFAVLMKYLGHIQITALKIKISMGRNS